MAYEITESIDGERDSVGRLQIIPSITFGQIFEGSPQYYPGSIVQVQEILEIRTRLYDESLVDTDRGWFFPKQRLGTFQIFDINGTVRTAPEDSGYLSIFNQRIYRYSYYTITANPSTQFGKHEQISLDNCNAYLTPEVYLFPDNPIPSPGYRYYDSNPLFLGSVTISKAPLADTEFNQLISGVGLKLKPGVEGVFLNYKVAVINDIYTDYESAPAPECEFISATCEQQLLAYIAAYPNFYDTQAECELANEFASCFPQVWTCPSDPTFVRQIWQIS